MALKSLTSQAIVLMGCYNVQGLDKPCPRLFDMSNFNDIRSLTAHVLNVQGFKTKEIKKLIKVYKYMLIQEIVKNKKYSLGIEMASTCGHFNDFKGLREKGLGHVHGKVFNTNNIKELRFCRVQGKLGHGNVALKEI